ncbi:MAG TPA: ammonium transporter [Actinomycetota bacterium]
MFRRRTLTVAGATLAFLGLGAGIAWAQEASAVEDLINEQKVLLDTVWTLVAAFLVFFMQAGFAMVEGGLTRQKNAANIVMKNLADFSMASIAYWAFGFAFMFGLGNAFVGTSGWFLGGGEGTFDSLSWATPPLTAKWLFQVVFAGTAATIVSGAMAERTKFKTYLLASGLIAGVIYPISGHWIWGGGWLAERGFLDFAGSTVVHSVGGWVALVGAIMVGARLGKFDKKGKPRAIPGHSIPMAILGVFILWFGWFGFNPGSTMGAILDIGLIAVNTNLAAAAGAITATGLIWFIGKKPDVAMAGNGALAGLVAITAPCAFVEPWAAVIIGALAGLIVVGSVIFFDRIRVDDPVGAISVHGVCGAFGTLSLGLFAAPRLTIDAGYGKSAGVFYNGDFAQLGVQALGVATVFLWAVVTAVVLFGILKATMGLRVSPEEELEGLDIGEHGMWGYPEIFLGASALPTPEAIESVRKSLKSSIDLPAEETTRQ